MRQARRLPGRHGIAARGLIEDSLLDIVAVAWTDGWWRGCLPLLTLVECWPQALAQGSAPGIHGTRNQRSGAGGRRGRGRPCIALAAYAHGASAKKVVVVGGGWAGVGHL